MRIPGNRHGSFACLTAICVGWATVDSSRAQTSDRWFDLERLRSGEIVTDYGDDERFQDRLRTAVLIAADEETIWEILKNCEAAPEYTPHVLACELIESTDDGLTEFYRQTVKYTWFLPRFDHVFRLSYEPFHRIGVHNVSGPIEHMEGLWELVPLEDGIVLTYDLELVSGMPIPRFVIAATLRNDIPEILSEVRTRAENAR